MFGQKYFNHLRREYRNHYQEDVARAKVRVLQMKKANVDANAIQWLAEHQLNIPDEINFDQKGIDKIIG